MMNFKEALSKKKFVVTVELCPPKGINVKKILSDACQLKGKVDGINVTDNQRSTMRLCPLVASHLLVKQGHSPIFQITCRDRNSLALQSDILGAAVLGIENILAITGDYPTKGDHPSVRPVFDLDSVQLINLIKKLEKGEDLSGRNLDGNPHFFVGGVVNPGVEPLEPQIIKLIKKIQAGTEFVQTQVIFDIEILKKFSDNFNKIAKKQKIKTLPKFIVGIFPLKSAKTAHFLNENVPGIYVPDKLIQHLEKSSQPQNEGIKMAIELIQNLQGISDGIHLMAMSEVEVMLEIIENL